MLDGLFNLLSFELVTSIIGAIDIIGISQDRQDIKVLEIFSLFGSALPLLSQYEISCAVEGEVEGEDEAEDEGEGAEEDGAVVGVKVGHGQGRGGREGLGRGGGGGEESARIGEGIVLGRFLQCWNHDIL